MIIQRFLWTQGIFSLISLQLTLPKWASNLIITMCYYITGLSIAGLFPGRRGERNGNISHSHYIHQLLMTPMWLTGARTAIKLGFFLPQLATVSICWTSDGVCLIKYVYSIISTPWFSGLKLSCNPRWELRLCYLDPCSHLLVFFLVLLMSQSWDTEHARREQ